MPPLAAPASAAVLLQVAVLGHLCAMAVCAALADVLAPGWLWLGALAYLLLQGGRAIHEAGHALVGQRLGLCPRAIRLGLLRMAVDFPDGAVWSAHPTTRRRTALAGSLAQAVFGLGLLAISAAWSRPGPSELIWLIGLVHLAALANLLPVDGADGAYLVAGAWRARPAWLPVVVAVLLQAGLPLLGTALRFQGGVVHAELVGFSGPGDVLTVGVALGLAVPVTRRVIDGPNGTDSGVYNAAVPPRVR
jgi:hypothetical protein